MAVADQMDSMDSRMGVLTADVVAELIPFMEQHYLESRFLLCFNQ